MISSGLRLALAPAALLAVAAAVSFLPASRERMARALAILAVGFAMALLITDIGVVVAQGSVEVAFGVPLAGVDLSLRADSTGVTLALVASTAALFALLDTGGSSGRAGAVLLCLAGSWGAALAGNAVVLFAGLEAANVGSALVMARGRRLPRGVTAGFVVQHLAALGLLGAAVQLTVGAGTSDFLAVPAGAVTTAIALPWALAGVARLAAPALAPAGGNLVWGAVAAVPAGAAVLLRLRNLAGALPLAAVVMMAIAGGLMALAGSARAARRARDPVSAGSGLLLAGAGSAVAVVGLTADAAGSAAGAALLSLELAVASAPLWVGGSGAVPARRLAAVAVACAGNLPIGFGLTAAILVIGAAASTGAAGTPLVAALGVASLLGAVAAVRSAATLLRYPPGGGARVPVQAALATVLSCTAALVPGAVAGALLPALTGGGVVTAADGLSVRAPQTGWAGGYLLIAAAWLVVVAVSASVLLGVRFEPAAPAGPAAAPPAVWLPLLRARRRVRRPSQQLLAAVAALDRWLVPQPRLPLLVIATLLAVFFLH